MKAAIPMLALLVLAALAVSAVPAHAQVQDFPTITFHVLGRDGSPIYGATITITQQGHFVKNFTTDANGTAIFAHIALSGPFDMEYQITPPKAGDTLYAPYLPQASHGASAAGNTLYNATTLEGDQNYVFYDYFTVTDTTASDPAYLVSPLLFLSVIVVAVVALAVKSGWIRLRQGGYKPGRKI